MYSVAGTVESNGKLQETADPMPSEHQRQVSKKWRMRLSSQSVVERILDRCKVYRRLGDRSTFRPTRSVWAAAAENPDRITEKALILAAWRIKTIVDSPVCGEANSV